MPTPSSPLLPDDRLAAGAVRDWPVPDPEGAPIAVVRDIRDAIDSRITDLLTQLGAA
ncbi:hypothetical protein [Streptomyces sp. NPDC090022]|uniref:hypothetical protein n=1 Tax=Streptomyces sp. NPDC090022 TaxID=3365920 RepID=UPI00380189EE